MLVEKELKNLGIEIKQELNSKKKDYIANKIANKLTTTFGNLNLSCLEIYYRLLNTPMFYAEIPEGMSQVNYFYKNSSVYFSDKLNIRENNEQMFHECIHKIQEHRDKKGNITRIGICEINEITVKNMALNEAAIQYIVTKCLKKPKQIINVYGINLMARTSYYPLITSLISQIAYLLGDKNLVESTINSNEEFKFEIIDNLGEITYNQINSGFDNILKLKNKIVELQKNGQIEEINQYIEEIRREYIQIQNTIYTSYFNKLFKRLETIDEVITYKRKLYLYKNLIGKVEGNTDFEEYYKEQDKKAEAKKIEIQRKTSLAVINNNIISKIFRKIKRLFTSSGVESFK